MTYQFQSTNYALRLLQGTDLLAFQAVAESTDLRDLAVLDLGCGAGRSTRFLTDLGAQATGIDISPEMIAQARLHDPTGTYLLLTAKHPLPFPDQSFDAFFSSWMLLEESSRETLQAILTEAARTLRPGGTGLVIVNTPEFYQGRWLSCKVDFPENTQPLRSGQPVRVALVPENVQLTDYFWTDADYKALFTQARLQLIEELRPLGDTTPWKDETHTAPYVIYRLRKG